jgi:hypothetical protein
MKPNLSFPLLGLLAATRAMGGAGLGLLLADRLDRKQRKRLGETLLAIGVLTTIPLLIHLVRRSRKTVGGVMEPQSEVYKPSYGIIDADIEMPDLEPGITRSSLRP